MLTVACVWVKGNVPYGVEYVAKLRGMVGRHLSQPFRFVCLTDRPELLPANVEGIKIALPKGLFGWWAKVELFSSRHGFTGRMLYLDLDTLVVSDLQPIVDYPAPFALVPHAGTFNGKHGLAVVKRFNSSVMAWDAGTQDHIFNNFDPAKTPKRLWGDQDLIGEQSPLAAFFPAEWFPRLSESIIDATSHSGKHWIWNGIPPEARVILCKTPKNTVAAAAIPAFAEAWG